MTADLVFYNENFGGDTKIPAASFPLWENRAKNYLMYVTGGKIEGKEDTLVKMCICEIAEFLYNKSLSDGIRSENNDGYSVVYQDGDIKCQVIKIAEIYLAGTEYLYRGVDNES